VCSSKAGSSVFLAKKTPTGHVYLSQASQAAKETIADINSKGMAWTIEQLNQWTKENLEGTRVSIMWRLVSPRCAERL
jgi:hypothetical protein